MLSKFYVWAVDKMNLFYVTIKQARRHNCTIQAHHMTKYFDVAEGGQNEARSRVSGPMHDRPTVK